MKKIAVLTWHQVYAVFINTGLLVFMLLTPLLVAMIIGFAFGGGDEGNLTISDVNVAVVNLDTGATTGAGDSINYGQIIANILLSQTGDDAITSPTAGRGDVSCEFIGDDTGDGTTDDSQFSGSLDDVLNATAVDDPAAARSGVDTGTYAAAVIIPDGFSQALSPELDFSTITEGRVGANLGQTRIDIYGNSGASISASVVRSITESIANQIVTGSVAISATVTTLAESLENVPALSGADDDDFAAFGCAFSPDNALITLDRQPVDETQQQSPFVRILVAMGSAQAVFFALFTANNAVLTIYQDKKTWILQRLFITPTPRWYFLAGKILGALLLVLIQVGLLLIFLTLAASIITQQLIFIWGSNIGLLLLLTLLVGLSVAGLGVFIVGIARDAQQAQMIGTLVAMGMAILGGAFGFSVPVGQQFSIIYWGVDAYEALSAGSTDIGLNLLVLGVLGLVLFSVGSWLFSRRIEI